MDRALSDNKTVLLLAPFYPPHTGAGVHRTLRFTKYLAEFGWNSIVVTKDWDAEEDVSSLIPPGVEVIRVKDPTAHPIPPSASNNPSNLITTDSQKPENSLAAAAKGKLRPIWHLLTETPDRFRSWSRVAAKKAIEVCRKRQVDIIYSTGPPHSVHLAGRQVAKATCIPFVADFRDPWARKSWQKKKNPLGQKLSPWFEKSVVSFASRVIANNDASLASFQGAYPRDANAGKFLAITNGFDSDLSIAPTTQNVVPANGSPLIVCHAGSLYGERDPKHLVKAVVSMFDSGIDIQFQQIGHCNVEFDPRMIAEKLGTPAAADLHAQMPHQQVMERMASADILVLIQPNAPCQVPGKLFEMLLFDQPIVAICDSPPTEKIVAEIGGISAPSSDPVAIEQALRAAIEMRNDPDLRKRRESARQKYDGKHLTKTLAMVFNSVAKQRASS